MAILYASFVAKAFIEAAIEVNFGNIDVLSFKDTSITKAKLTKQNVTYAQIEINDFNITTNMTFGGEMNTNLMLKMINIVENKLEKKYTIDLI